MLPNMVCSPSFRSAHGVRCGVTVEILDRAVCIKRHWFIREHHLDQARIGFSRDKDSICVGHRPKSACAQDSQISFSGMFFFGLWAILFVWNFGEMCERNISGSMIANSGSMQASRERMCAHNTITVFKRLSSCDHTSQLVGGLPNICQCYVCRFREVYANVYVDNVAS